MSILNSNAALRGLLDQHLADLSREEGLAPETIRDAIERGTMVLLGNPSHPSLRPILVGQPARVKVNANIGTSPMRNHPECEMQKVDAAVEAGADTVMDLSIAGDLDAIRREMLARCPLPLGTVPLYSVAQRYIDKDIDPADIDPEELFAEVEMQAEQGVDFMTLHCGITRRGVELASEGGRVTGIVSRGGSILGRWMRRHGEENPFLTHYDDILDICLAHNVTISLGDGMRPGCGADAGDGAQWEEVINLGRLAARAKARGVQTMIEGPGHVPLHLVQSQIQGIKRLTDGAPLYVLGPLTTDCAPGYDHIAGAIGGALAAYFGADFLCYLTPAEHLTLPNVEDVRAGIKASLIAAQSAETALGRPHAAGRDLAMSQARADLDWEAMTELSLDPDMVRARRAKHSKEKECAMCGAMCAMRMMTTETFECPTTGEAATK